MIAPFELKRRAIRLRRRFLKMHFENKAGHIGSGLSAIDILLELYSNWLQPDDRFILSKGHSASALYVTLNLHGLLSDEELATYYQDGTLLPAHPAALALPAITAATGSLGHGLPIATGLAYAAKRLDQSDRRVACLLSDGECNAGTVWEAAMLASHHRLDNLMVIIDLNGLQGFGRTEEVIDMAPMGEKWTAFGFEVREVDGHDFDALRIAFGPANSRRPTCVIARTIKGKGVSFLEDRLESHYNPLDAKQLALAIAELDEAERRLAEEGA